MNEWYHIKGLFQCLYDRILRIIHWINWNIFIQLRLLFMSKDKEKIFWDSIEKKRIDNMNKLINDMIISTTVICAASMISSSLIKNKTEVKENGK